MRRTGAAVLGFAVLALQSAGIAPLSARDDEPRERSSEFVTTDGTRFMLHGEAFPVAGVNNHYLTFGSEQEVVRVLDDAAAMHANLVRIFLQPVVGSLDGVSVPTIWNWRSRASASDLGVKGTYFLYWDEASNAMAVNEGVNGLQKLDFLLTEAKKRNLKVLVALLDFWSYTGGAQQMRAWYGSQDERMFFAADPRTRRDYETWARYVLTRVNTISHVRYRDDPTVFAWELMNEPNISPPALLRNWIAEMSAVIKAIDPNHLVATGHANVYRMFSDLELTTIDFGTWHGYPVHWGISADAMTRKIPEFCKIAAAHGKPMLWEEFGYDRANPDQAQVYATWLATLHNDPDCAGWVVWRLVSRQDDGRYPVDRAGGFDIHNDGKDTWRALKAAAELLTARK